MYAKLEIEPTWKNLKTKGSNYDYDYIQYRHPDTQAKQQCSGSVLAYLSRPARCASRVSSSLAPAAVRPPFGIRVVQTSLDSGLGPLRGRVESQKADARGTFPAFRSPMTGLHPFRGRGQEECFTLAIALWCF
ncbi:hypothetical protein TWF703_007749 [Orbilia oligospora]|nr:hypothetical protein TWF703_007749 [Orbilia oligospora]